MNPQLPRLSRDMSLVDFATFGVEQLAYIKPVVIEGTPAYAVHGADGRPLAAVGDRDVAFALVRQNDLEPVSVH